MMKHWLRRAFLVSMLAGSALITAMSLEYFDFETLPPFVLEKLPLRFEALWLASLRIHVAAAAATFPVCLALMTRTLQRRPVLHRWLGRTCGVLVLFALLPSGVVLAFEAKGGSVVSVGFFLSAGIIGVATVLGVQSARKRNWGSHARAMRHVVGQMSVAVVSRAMMLGFDTAGVDPDVAYVLALWVPVLASTALVEVRGRRAATRIERRIDRTERNRSELPPLALVVRLRALVRPLARLGR